MSIRRNKPAGRVKRELGNALNIVLLLLVTPALMFALLAWIYRGRPEFSLVTLLPSQLFVIGALVFWHIFVWEHVIKIRRQWVLFLIRATKAAWMLSVFGAFVTSNNSDTKLRYPIFISSVLCCAVIYAWLRQFFAPRYRI